MMDARERGQVKWFSQVKGYGFVQRLDGKPDAFVHINDFRSREDAYWVRDGDSLDFSIIVTQKGPRAVDVQVA
jgi:CspA family cold shock protein